MPQHLILASTSPWRAQLLTRLGLPFTTEAPEVDESARSGETAPILATRLARLKADRVARQLDERPSTTGSRFLVIGSDQVACLGGDFLGKPGTVEAAQAQLRKCSGQAVRFHTALCVRSCGEGGETGRITVHGPPLREVVCDLTTVHLRRLSDAEIERYVLADAPLSCAGSFRAEALGITLFERIESRDPTALVGLPLIALTRLLRLAGLPLP